jgi:hypothetical protein
VLSPWNASFADTGWDEGFARGCLAILPGCVDVGGGCGEQNVLWMSVKMMARKIYSSGRVCLIVDVGVEQKRVVEADGEG